jgi:hypothetical protein
MIMGRSKWVGAAIIPLLLAGGWYWGSPLWTLKQMRDAAQVKDVDALASHVDFPALREDVKAEMLAEFFGRPQIGDEYLDQFEEEGPKEMIESHVDALFSPAGLRNLLDDKGVMVGDEKIPLAIKLDAYALERVSLSEFRLKSKKSGDGKVMFEFRRYGLSWKLAGINLPHKDQ